MRRLHRWLLALAVAMLTGSLAAGTSAQEVLSLSISDVSVTEGNSGTVDAVFTVRLSAAPSQDVSVAFATADGSAKAVGDYQAKQGTLTFLAGSAVVAQTVAVRVFGDKVPEPDEGFVVNLSNPTNASIADAQGRGTIVDDDPFPQLSISNPANVVEGNGGTVDAVFTVTLPRSDSVTSQAVTVEFATFDGSATAGSDYGSRQGTLSFPATLPGVSQQALQVRVPVFGETAREAHERFFVRLSNPTNAVLAVSAGSVTILNDDSGIRFSGGLVREASFATFFLPLSLTHPNALPVAVTYATADGTAKAGSDYVAIPPTTFTFAAGSTSEFLELRTTNDEIGEPNETFFVNLSSPVNAVIDTPQALITIEDDEPRITIADASGFDAFGAPVHADFAVTVSGGHAHEVRIGYATANGTAVAGRDYVARSGTLVFPRPGSQAKTQIIRVSVIGDRAVEQDEAFVVNLSNPVGVFITDSRGVGTIFDASDVSGVGVFELTPTDASVEVHDRLRYAFTWTVPPSQSWHDLDLLELRIRDDAGTIMWIRFHEATNTFALVDPKTGKEGERGRAGDHKKLKTKAATLYLADSSVVGSGPTGPSVTLNLSLGFKPKARGRTYAVEVLASDDAGQRQAFELAGSLTVE